jgi:hypothetical protein
VKARVRSATPFVVLAGASLLVACRGAPANDAPPDAGVSPQAKAEPAPLEMAVTSSAQPFAPDAGPPPVPLRSDEVVPADAPPADVRGWELDAFFRTADVPPAFRGPETSIGAIDSAKKKTEPDATIDFTPSRMTLTIANRAFLVPAGTEIRARADRYGHFVLLPETHQVRIAAPGSLRTLFAERRIDVEPLVTPLVTDRGEGARRLGYRTRRVEVASRVATATFDLARVDGVGDGGALVCRALLDLMNAPPSSPVCGLDEVPLHVEWKWVTKGTLFFDAIDLTRRADLAPTTLAAPPAGDFVLPALPALLADAILEPTEIAAFRSAPADLPLAPDASTSFPSSGLALANGGDQTRFAFLDGVAVAWVAPGARLVLPSLLRGRYGFEWRTFFGDAYDAPTTINVPSTQIAGASDAGTP